MMMMMMFLLLYLNGREQYQECPLKQYYLQCHVTAVIQVSVNRMSILQHPLLLFVLQRMCP